MKKGFTLIELVCVLGVLAIIAAIAIPSIKGMQDEADLAKVQADLLILQSAAEAYYFRFGTFPVSDYQSELIDKTGLFTQKLLDPLTKKEYVFYAQGRYYAVLSPGNNRRIDFDEADLGRGFYSKNFDDLLATNLKVKN